MGGGFCGVHLRCAQRLVSHSSTVHAVAALSAVRFSSRSSCYGRAAKKYAAFLASDSVIKMIPRLLGPGLNKAGKFPTLIGQNDNLEGKVRCAKGADCETSSPQAPSRQGRMPAAASNSPLYSGKLTCLQTSVCGCDTDRGDQGLHQVPAEEGAVPGCRDRPRRYGREGACCVLPVVRVELSCNRPATRPRCAPRMFEAACRPKALLPGAEIISDAVPDAGL
jgi:hypothetical protein